MLNVAAKNIALTPPGLVLRRGRVGVRGTTMFADRGERDTSSLVMGPVEAYWWDGRKAFVAVLRQGRTEEHDFRGVSDEDVAKIRHRLAFTSDKGSLKRMAAYLESKAIARSSSL